MGSSRFQRPRTSFQQPRTSFQRVPAAQDEVPEAQDEVPGPNATLVIREQGSSDRGSVLRTSRQ